MALLELLAISTNSLLATAAGEADVSQLEVAAESGGADASTWIALFSGIVLIVLVLARRRVLRRRQTDGTNRPTSHAGSHSGAGQRSAASVTGAASARPATPAPAASARRRAGGADATARGASEWNDADGPTRAGGPAGNERRQLADSMQALMLELEQMSRQVGGQIDTRLRALNLLIKEADQKIAELKRLGLSSGAEPGGQSSGTRSPASSSNAADRRKAAGSPSPAAADPAEDDAGQAPSATSADDKYARVYSLAAEGRSVVEIGRELELMTGEVELILALRRNAAGRS